MLVLALAPLLALARAQMDMWGAMNDLMDLGYATTSDEAALHYANVYNRTDNVAFYELSLLLGNDNFSSTYFQTPEEVSEHVPVHVVPPGGWWRCAESCELRLHKCALMVCSSRSLSLAA